MHPPIFSIILSSSDQIAVLRKSYRICVKPSPALISQLPHNKITQSYLNHFQKIRTFVPPGPATLPSQMVAWKQHIGAFLRQHNQATMKQKVQMKKKDTKTVVENVNELNTITYYVHTHIHILISVIRYKSTCKKNFQFFR